MQILLGFSAGYDSTYLLYNYLKNTNDTIRCFRLDLSAVEYDHPQAKRGYYRDLMEAESVAAVSVISWMRRNVRNFGYEVINVDKIEEGEWMTPTVIRHAAVLCNDRGYDKFVIGRSAENDSPQQGKLTHPWYRKLWSELCVTHAKLEWPLLDQRKGRAHAIKELPKQVQTLLISCHDAKLVNGKPTACGICNKCIITAESKTMVDKGIDPYIVLDYHLKKKGAGKHSKSMVIDERYQSGVRGKPMPFLKHANWK